MTVGMPYKEDILADPWQLVYNLRRFMSQPFAVAQVFTGIEGRLVSLKDTIQAFKQILAGDHDALPESAFYSESRRELSPCTQTKRSCSPASLVLLLLPIVVGGIDDVKAKAAQLTKDMAA